MTNRFRRASISSSIVSGVYSGVGFLLIMYVKNHYNLETAQWNQFAAIISVIFFLLPFVLFVVGLEFIIDRFKNITPTFFIFLSCEKDLKAFGRMLLWFLVIAMVFLPFSGLTYG